MKMSRLFNAIGRFFKGIFRFIDKKIVLPISRICVSITNKFKSNGRSFEKIITRKPGLIIISLLISIGAFFIANSKSTSLI